MNKVVVVGAGASGLIASIFLSNNNKVILIDKNKKVGRKLLITGKGRCNITNNCDTNTFINNLTKNPKFMYSAINNFTPQDTMKFFEDLGLELKTERGNRVFPASDKAMDVVDALYNKINNNKNIEFITDKIESVITRDNKAIGVKSKDNEYLADDILICTGGMSYPLTGSTGDGYKFAKDLGHTVIDTIPSLVSLVSNDWYCKELQGLSLKNVKISVYDSEKSKVIYNDFGELLFTHFGLSGPTILSASAHMRNMTDNRYKVSIDLKPALDFDTLDKRIIRDFEKFSNKDICNSLGELLPKTLIPVVLRRLKIDDHIKCNSVNKETRKEIVKLLKDFTVSINGFSSIDEAIVTSGGISVKEINPKTMESKLINNLYFSGEVLDLDAYTGGFNLQIAFATGKLAADSINNKEI